MDVRWIIGILMIGVVSALPPSGFPTDDKFTDQGIVMQNGGSGEWDAKEYIQLGSIVKKDGTYFLYYTGSVGDRRDGGAAYRAVGLATSTDGKTFTKYSGNPIVTFIPQPAHENAEEEGAEVPVVTLDDGNFVMYYCASTATGSYSVDADIRIATSSDGFNFTDQGIVLGETSEAWTTGVIHAQGGTSSQTGSWHVYFTSDRPSFGNYLNGLLTGDTPKTMSIQPNSPVFTGNAPIPWVWPILHSDDSVTLFETSGGWSVSEIKVRETTVDSLDTYSAPVMTIKAADNPHTEHYGSYGGHIVYPDEDANMWRQYYVATAGSEISVRLRTAPMSNPQTNERTVLYNFDTGGPLECTGTSPNIVCTDTDKWTGWSYDENVRSGRGGFESDIDPDYQIFWGNYAGDQGWLEIDNTRGAKGTTGSLRVRTTGTSDDGAITRKSDELNYPERVDNKVGGLPYFDFFTYKQRPELVGKFRISVYVWIPNNWMLYKSYDGWNDYNWHFGTYVCSVADNPCVSRSGCNPYSPGEPCNGSQSHFYHHYTFGQWGGGGWVKLLIDQNPQHKRNFGTHEYNPSQAMFGEDYVPSLNRIYFEVTGRNKGMDVPVPIDIWVDEIEAYTRAYYAEQDQNEITIASPAVGYYPNNDGHWEISWDASDTRYGTYEVKYSLTEFTNSNFNTNGFHIDPLANKAGTGLVGKLHKDDYSFKRYATYFDLPDEYEVAGEVVYFAIMDDSETGQHGTAELDGATDDRTSTDDRIYSLMYHVPGLSVSTCPNGHCDSGETCMSCASDCHSAHAADDSPCNGCVEVTEITEYVDDWRKGDVEINNLMEAIGKWKDGCY